MENERAEQPQADYEKLTDSPAQLVRVDKRDLESILRENREVSDRCDDLQGRMSEMLMERRALAGLQGEVARWVRQTLGDESLDNLRERALRFLEEALELAQSCGITGAEAERQLKEVYMCNPGPFRKEVGDAGLTLFALSEALRLELLGCVKARLKQLDGLAEAERIKQHHEQKRADGLTCE